MTSSAEAGTTGASSSGATYSGGSTGSSRATRETVAELNRRMAQLGWPANAEAESDAEGAEWIVVRPMSQGATLPSVRWAAPADPPSDAVDRIVHELRSNGWGDRPLGNRSDGPFSGALWCVPD